MCPLASRASPPGASLRQTVARRRASGADARAAAAPKYMHHYTTFARITTLL